MILVSGGQLDVSIGRLLRRCLKRGEHFRDVLVGPDSMPTVCFSPSSDELVLNGEPIRPGSCFLRHDVFLTNEHRSRASQISLNWFHAIRGWAQSSDQIFIFNKYSSGAENNKVKNLKVARMCGLQVPETRITNLFNEQPDELIAKSIAKPVAGGEYTKIAASFCTDTAEPQEYPMFLQERLIPPELRIYRVGDEYFGFRIISDSIDYRQDSNTKIEHTTIDSSIIDGFAKLCETLGLDFAAADFLHTQKNEISFLEVNTQPMFAAFDDVLDGKLCDAILDTFEERAKAPQLPICRGVFPPKL